jgi:hypothetical protein
MARNISLTNELIISQNLSFSVAMIPPKKSSTKKFNFSMISNRLKFPRKKPKGFNCTTERNAMSGLAKVASGLPS